MLDGAVLVLCGVSGVQSQTYTVDRQMKRYGVPRLTFINKLDRMGANPWKVLKALKDKLGLRCEAVQIPIGSEGQFTGVIDIISMCAYYYEGGSGYIFSFFFSFSYFLIFFFLSLFYFPFAFFPSYTFLSLAKRR